MTELHWLPACPDWREQLRALPAGPEATSPEATSPEATSPEATSPEATGFEAIWAAGVRLANTRLDFLRTNALDAAMRAILSPATPDAMVAAAPIRLAVLGSCTTAHLLPAIRVGGMRRGLRIDALAGGFGQYRQEIAGPPSAVDAFRPDAVLLALDAWHLSAGIDGAADDEAAAAVLRQVVADIRALWSQLRDRFGCMILQQAVLPVHPPVLGDNEHRLPASRAGLVMRLNLALREAADADAVDILAVDSRSARDGIARWHDPALWHRAKQEIAGPAVPLYGDLVARWLAARRGRSAKCLVLDLDNTLWGGTIADDGPAGIVLGPGSAEGEAFAAFQTHLRALARRGVILAVCSKNDEARALEPFDSHPDMVLRRDDIAVFVANWDEKPANLRAIAAALGIGLDAMVFFDDSPFERGLVRRELPMVAVPEPGDEPARYAAVLADAGYFEALSVTAEDRARTALYHENRTRATLQAAASDLGAYLRSLAMRLDWRPFDRAGLQRIVQLINKTNQFNLTARRMTEDAVVAVMNDPDAFGLQLRLRDRFGDNGMIAVVIGRLDPDGDVRIDTWLMSCRVLGREVEHATLAIVAERARALGGRRLVGEYVPTARNGMVRDLYPRLGFTLLAEDTAGRTRWLLDLAAYRPVAGCIDIISCIDIKEGPDNAVRGGCISGVDRDISRRVPA